MRPRIDHTCFPVEGDLLIDAVAAGPTDGDPVLLLHGFPQSSSMWLPQLDALAAAGFRAVAPDQRGYSPRARPADVAAYGIADLGDDVLAIADGLGAERYSVVGHDWGAVVAWYLAALRPERVASLTALSVPHPAAFALSLASPDGDQRRRSSYIAFFQKTGLAERVLSAGGLSLMLRATRYPGDVGERVRAMSQPGALTAALNWYRAVDVALLGGVGRIQVPTLFVWSTGDEALGREGAEATAGYVDGPYRFEVLDGVSHWIPEEVPGRLNRLLLAHLGSQ
jgi:pimeloyl-ACP methyl ester carboxylesterase